MTEDKRPQGPLWRYFGGKWRARKTYPEPRYQTIVEPFAGAASYSLWHGRGRDIILADASPHIRAIWLSVTQPGAADRIRALPDLQRGVDVRTQSSDPGLACLMGSWCNDASAGQRWRPTEWALLGQRRCTWNIKARDRCADVVDAWRPAHVSVLDDWRSCPDIEATWFIDPPYIAQGHHYTHGSEGIDYDDLADWCMSRRGQVIVCEAEGADWLPFRPHARVQAMMSSRGKRFISEVIWTNDPACVATKQIGYPHERP